MCFIPAMEENEKGDYFQGQYKELRDKRFWSKETQWEKWHNGAKELRGSKPDDKCW